ncbi:hypothetical protein [Leptolyngbya sp. PCC 6406]|uniref:hypothetical protein n=1 Tax=Leptolyngbya sp. PCC 6406 TaxID=1173264 RepID=UPI0002ACDF55|nr:hypothetical protein [Leptolyngbya sp. PCC 6406]
MPDQFTSIQNHFTGAIAGDLPLGAPIGAGFTTGLGYRSLGHVLGGFKPQLMGGHLRGSDCYRPDWWYRHRQLTHLQLQLG